ncbi:hypothetical protein GH714_013594 [Hevea brasiliensis]|uniref:GH18 domain-containing protein n=1 Tax=Hevea brasiliensis TaxID=3981 RepID=A0A6A6LG92_HEVBR|nr:hypothetical protein GH714_013594 [Hevea brasiliensis]
MQDTSIHGAQSHPLHLHGFNFFVVGQGFGNFDPNKDPTKFNLVDSVERNTVRVPSSAWVSIRFFVDNPATTNSRLFREYIGAEGKGVRFTYVPANPNVEVHFILSFAIDYSSSSNPFPTNGDFSGFARKYKLDGIDIDYEHLSTDSDTFAECIGRLLFYLKEQRILSFASMAPYNDHSVQPYYLALWKKYGHVIDYVNFLFYAYPNETSVPQFMKYIQTQNSNYGGGTVLLSFGTDESGGLYPQNGFFDAFSSLRGMNKLHGIFLFGLRSTPRSQGFIMKSSHRTFWLTQNVLSILLDSV